MDVAIPPEFESYAREQVKAGAVASEEEAAIRALRLYAAHIADIRALVDPAIAQADRAEGMDGVPLCKTSLRKPAPRMANETHPDRPRG